MAKHPTSHSHHGQAAHKDRHGHGEHAHPHHLHEEHNKAHGAGHHNAHHQKHRIHLPYDGHSCDRAHYPESKLNTSWAVLDRHGNLIEAESHNPEDRKDPASTTKLWTFYTVATLVHEGKLPKDFIQKHHPLIERMLVHSENIAAMYVAQAAGGSYKDFCGKMNELAEKEGLHHSHFDVPYGMPNMGNYSTAHDMARMAYLLDRDFPKLTHWAGIKKDSHGAGTGAYALDHGWEWGKTGTGGGCHQPHGVISYTGKTEDGHYAALSGAKNKNIYHELVSAIGHAVERLHMNDGVLHKHHHGLEVAEAHPDHVHAPSRLPHPKTHQKYRD